MIMLDKDCPCDLYSVLNNNQKCLSTLHSYSEKYILCNQLIKINVASLSCSAHKPQEVYAV